jgi:CDP-glucose 4,6-dehydratase
MNNNFFKGKNILITGISGFIGINLAVKLLNLGANVTGIIKDLNSANSNILSSCNIVVGDVNDYMLLCDTIARNEIEIVVHLAASSIVKIAATDPYNTYKTNIMGTVALLEAIRNVGTKVKSIVVASSDKAYGDHDMLPYVEDFSLQPKNTYDTSKACCDLISRAYASNYDMPISVSRCSNVYGPGDFNFSRLIPNSIRRILDGEKPVIYRDIENMTREFIFVDDVIDAYLAVIHDQLTSKHLVGKAFNIGGTGGYKINEVISKICDLMGKEKDQFDVKEREKYFKEIEKQYISAKFLKETTGWEPKTSLEDGLNQTIQWYTRVFTRQVNTEK